MYGTDDEKTHCVLAPYKSTTLSRQKTRKSFWLDDEWFCEKKLTELIKNRGKNGRRVHKINNAEGKLICIWEHEWKKNRRVTEKKNAPRVYLWSEKKESGCFHLCIQNWSAVSEATTIVCCSFDDGQYVGGDFVSCEYK